MKIRLKKIGDSVLVRVLIRHPMENGHRTDTESGRLIPAHFINRLTVTHQDQVVASCALGPGVSKDPYFAFRFQHGKTGDSVTIAWSDNLGNSDRVTETIP